MGRHVAPLHHSATQWPKQVYYQLDDDEVCCVLDQHALQDFYSANSLKQQSVDRHVSRLGHIILIPSQPVFAFLLFLSGEATNTNVYGLWFYLNVAQTHDQPHSR